MNALKRNTRLELTYFPTKQIFDASILKDKFDIILLWQNFDFGMPEEIPPAPMTPTFIFGIYLICQKVRNYIIS